MTFLAVAFSGMVGEFAFVIIRVTIEAVGEFQTLDRLTRLVALITSDRSVFPQ